MNAFAIAFKLLKTNFQSYKLYGIIMTIAVAVYYNFVALKFNPQIRAISDISYVFLAIWMCTIIFVFFIYYFMFSSNAFLLKRRTKEIALYFLMGIENGKIGLVFAIESIFIMMIAILAGLFFGIATSKLFIMGFAKIAVIDIVIDFAIPLEAIKELLYVFMSMSLILVCYNYKQVSNKKLIDLLNYANKMESAPKFKLIKGILSVILIVGGYYFCQGMFENQMMLFIGLFVVIIEIIGTNMFFGSFLSTILNKITADKNTLYKGENITAFSNLAFRVNSNYKTWAMIAICIATAITTLAASITLWYYVNILNTDGLQNFAQVSHRSSLYISTLFSYLGSILAGIFIFVLGETLYFRILSEGMDDKNRYDVLSKIGMTQDEMRKSINKQVGFSMIFPTVIGIAHAGVAIFLLEDVLNVSVAVPLLVSVIIFLIFYFIFYLLIANRFFKLVTNKSN